MIQIKSLSQKEVKSFFERTTNDFNEFMDSGYVDTFSKKLSENAKFVVCYDENDEICGLIAFYMNNQKFAYLTHVSICSEQRGKGLFTKMLHFLENYAIDSCYKVIRLEVNKLNINAQNVYKKVGFSIVEESEKSWFMEKNLRCSQVMDT